MVLKKDGSVWGTGGNSFGELGDVYIPRNRETRESRGFAFVRFMKKEDAEKACSLDGKELAGGRAIDLHRPSR